MLDCRPSFGNGASAPRTARKADHIGPFRPWCTSIATGMRVSPSSVARPKTRRGCSRRRRRGRSRTCEPDPRERRVVDEIIHACGRHADPGPLCARPSQLSRPPRIHQMRAGPKDGERERLVRPRTVVLKPTASWHQIRLGACAAETLPCRSRPQRNPKEVARKNDRWSRRRVPDARYINVDRDAQNGWARAR